MIKRGSVSQSFCSWDIWQKLKAIWLPQLNEGGAIDIQGVESRERRILRKALNKSRGRTVNK